MPDADVAKVKAQLVSVLQPLWEEGCAHALLERARYPDPRTDITTVREMLMSLCSDAISQLADAHNLRSPVSRLPDSLLAAIFALVPIRECAAVGSVCRSWNRVMYSYPAIWSCVDHNGRYGTGECLARILSFSKEASLHLNLRLSAEYCENFSYALAKHIRRCVTLRLVLSRALKAEAVEAVAAALTKPAPQLRELRFFDNSRVYSKPSVPLFMGIAPCLNIVKMECDITALRSSTATFALVKGVLYSPPGRLSVDDLRQLVRLFPAAEELAVDFNQSDGSFDQQAQQPIRLPSSLRSFFVVAHKRTADASRVLRAVQADRVPDVCVPHGEDAVNSIFNQAALDTMYNLAAPGPLQNQRLYPFIARSMSLATTMLTEESMSVVMHETEEDIFEPLPSRQLTSGQDLRQPGVRRSTWDIGNRVTLQPAMFMQLRRLELTEVAFDPDLIVSSIPPLPALLHLTILFLRYVSHARTGRVCGFVWAAIAPSESEHQARTLVCPRLQTLRIGAIESRNPRIEPSAITAFVKRHLRYDAKQLAEILFYGTDLFVTDPGQFEEMLQLAHITKWDPRYLGPAFKRIDILNWW